MAEHTKYCCGLHEICEKGLSHKPCHIIEYYDDEELDVFKGHPADSYIPDEIQQFRDVLETMYTSDVPGWIQSLKLRGIEPPELLKERIISIIHS